MTFQQFADELVRGGLNGGEEAALGLLRATFREFEYYDDFRRDEKIVIKVYANLKGLSKTYVSNKILGRTEDFYEFVTGFNKMNALVDLTDAGNAKDGADRKLQGLSLLLLLPLPTRKAVYADGY